MRLMSWNVNGLRAVLKKDFEDIITALDADVVSLQETKLQEGQATLAFPQYYQYWSYAEKKGYSGTAVLCKEKPLKVLHGLGCSGLDTEGRIVALEFERFWLVNVYTPNAQNELARIEHRLKWDAAFRAFCKGLEQGVLPEGSPIQRNPLGEGHVDISRLEVTQVGETALPKPVVMCGDFNVAHKEIDLKNPGPNRGKAGFSDEERSSFDALLDEGFVDTFRKIHPEETGAYSWWSYRFKARENNAGWRIDYFLVSVELATQIKEACICSDIYGSDHCPVALELSLG